MSEIAFDWSGICPSYILGKTFHKISVVQLMHINPLEVIISMPSDNGLRIRSRMHDIAERKEVGVLEFSEVRQPDWSSYLETVELAHEFRDKVRVDKLVLGNSGDTIRN